MAAGVERAEFLDRLKKILEGHTTTAMISGANNTSDKQGANGTDNATVSEALGPQEAEATVDQPPHITSDNSSQPSARNFVPESYARESDDSRRISTSAKGKQRAEESPEPPSDPAKEQAQSYAAQARQRKKTEREELQRVLRLVEADKAERRAQDERRKAASAPAENVEERSGAQKLPKTSASERRSSDTCHLQVRLLDGSTIRKQFPASATLAADVRPWIASEMEQTSGRSSRRSTYTFKHILTPLPNRAISADDEKESVTALNLLPSATLVLVPGHGAASSASASGSVIRSTATNVLSIPYKIAARIHVYLIGWLLSIIGLLKSVPGLGNRSSHTSADNRHGETRSARSSKVADGATASGTSAQTANQGTRIQTLRDRGWQSERDEHGEQQLYNGNQVSRHSRLHLVATQDIGSDKGLAELRAS